MFDIAPSEFMLIAAVAVLCIGPKDMPRALRTAGRWMGRMRRMSNHLRSGMETIIREAELEEMEQKWREQNEAIMREHPPEQTPVDGALVGHAPSPSVLGDPPSVPIGSSEPMSLPPTSPAHRAG